MTESFSVYPEGSSGVRQLSKAPQHNREDLCSSNLMHPLWKNAKQSLVLAIISGCLHKHRTKQPSASQSYSFKLNSLGKT